MSRLSALSGKQLVKALERAGFQVTHQRGSHVYLRVPGRPALVTVPVHGNRDLPIGTLRAVLRQAGLSPERLRELL